MNGQRYDDFPIRLEQVFFTRQAVEAIPSYVPKGGPTIIDMVPKTTIKVHPVPNREKVYAVAMRVVFNDAKESTAPYFIDMECHAIFIGNAAFPDDEIKKAATITGHSVVYGAIREAVYWMTGRQPYGPMPFGLSILKPAEDAQKDATE